MTIVIKPETEEESQYAVRLIEMNLRDQIISRMDAVHSLNITYILRNSTTLGQLHRLATHLDDKQIDYE